MLTRELILVEMNVANEDDLQKKLLFAVNHAALHRQKEIKPDVRDLLVKRFAKAMKNDDAGEMVNISPVETLPDNAPDWMAKAMEKGDLVNLEPKSDFLSALDHIVDWVVVDKDAIKTVRTAPERALFASLTKAADDFFAEQAAKETENTIEDETGREVVLTFRSKGGEPVAYKESSLEPDPVRGDVVAFWAQLTSPEALNREGRMMSHCVGSYANVVLSQQTRIYSLRDAKNEPHATIEVKDNPTGTFVNQVKGKGNRAPVGRYTSYVKAFLNTLGIKASGAGERDVMAMGLFTHEGKFGNIDETNIPPLTQFPDGSRLFMQGHYSLFYVEKDNTTPLSFSVYGSAKDGFEKGNQVTDLKVLRPETSRYAFYIKNLAPFFTKNELTTRDGSFEHIGLYYDPVKKFWGSLEDVSTVMLEANGLRVTSRVVMSTSYSWRKFLITISDGNVPVLEITFGGSGSPEYNDIVAVKMYTAPEKANRLPPVVAAFLNHIRLDWGSLSEKNKSIWRSFGATWNSRKKEYMTPIDEGREIVVTKQGSVRAIGSRLYLFDPREVLLGTCDARGGKIEPKDCIFFGDATLPTALLLLAAAALRQEKPDADRIGKLTINGFNERRFVDAGWMSSNGKLTTIANVVNQRRSLPGGLELVSEIIRNGEIAYKAKDSQNNILAMIEVQADRNLYLRSTLDKATPELVAAMVKTAKIAVPKKQLFGIDLMVKNGKIVPFTRDADSFLYSYVRDLQVDVGDGFVLVAPHDRKYAYLTGKLTGQMKFGEHVVANFIQDAWSDEDPSIRILRKLPPDVPRDALMKAISKLMKFYHSKLEYYDSTDPVTG